MSQSVSQKLPLAAIALALAASTTALGVVERVETFDTDPNWTSLNNRDPGGSGQDFGFSNTNNAGAAAGEAGGAFRRNANPGAYYADDIGGVTISDPLSFSGSFNPVSGNTEVLIGFFNASQAATFTPSNNYRVPNFLGFKIDQLRFRFSTITNRGNPPGSDARDPLSGVTEEDIGFATALNTKNTFSFSYTPGADGADEDSLPDSATISATINGAAIAPQILTDVSQLGEFITFDRFGLHSKGSDSSQGPINAFFDDLHYTAADAAGLLGDFNADQAVNATDIDLLCDRINAGTGDVELFDVNNDGSVNMADVNFEVTNILETKFGDTDTDGDVDLNDLGNLASGFGQPGEKRWSRGNFDCDLDVDLPDLGTLATNFDAGRAAALAQFEALVPEPSSLALVGLGALGMLARRRHTA